MKRKCANTALSNRHIIEHFAQTMLFDFLSVLILQYCVHNSSISIRRNFLKAFLANHCKQT